MKLARAKAILLICLLASCSVNKYSQSAKLSDNFCEPATSYSYTDLYRPQSVNRYDSSLTARFSKHDLLLANAMGILPLLQEVSQLQPKGNSADRIERITKLQKIQNRFSLASTEISSLAAELDCEGERADQLATYLDQNDQRRIRNLTLLSIAVGAATTVAAALIQGDKSDRLVGIGGGLLGAGLGGAAAVSSNKSVFFSHKRNLLADIWDQSEQSSAYSPFIWYVLNEKLFSNGGQYSIRHNIRQRWQSYVLKGSSSQEQQLYFGLGGNYQADDLHKRANMLNQLQSSVRSINQDLQSLLTHFITVFE